MAAVIGTPGARSADMKLEVVVILVSDVDRGKRSYDKRPSIVRSRARAGRRRHEELGARHSYLDMTRSSQF